MASLTSLSSLLDMESIREETLAFKLLIMLPISSSVNALNNKLFAFLGKYLLKVLVASIFWHSDSPMLVKKSLNTVAICL